MNVETPSSLKGAVDGQQVLAFKGRIKAVYQQTTGTNDHGDYKIQNILVEDGKNELKVKLDGRDAIPKTAVGQTFYAVATKSEKHGWVGTKFGSETYKGKTTPVLKVTQSAELQIGGEATTDAPAESRSAAPTEAPPRSDAAPAKQKPKDPTVALKLRIAQLMNAEHAITDAADILQQAYVDRHGEEMPLEIYVGIQGRFFIQLVREGLIDAMPSKLNPALAKAAEHIRSVEANETPNA
jgi:hypothetical protein